MELRSPKTARLTERAWHEPVGEASPGSLGNKPSFTRFLEIMHLAHNPLPSCAKSAGTVIERARLVDIIAVETCMNVTVRSGESFAQRMALASVLFAHPPSEMFFVLSDNLDTLIRAPAVNNDVLQVGITLQQNRANGLFEVLSLIVRWCAVGYHEITRHPDIA